MSIKKAGTRRLLFEETPSILADQMRNVSPMAYPYRFAVVVTLLLACVVLDGCATAKKLVPWGTSDSDANATTPVEPSDGSETATADEPATTKPADDRDLTLRSETLSDQSTKPVDLTVPRVERGQAAISDPPQSDFAKVSDADGTATSAPSAENPNNDGSTGVEEWGRAVQQAIHGRWTQPRGPNIPTDFSCDVMVKLTPFGGVDEVEVVRSCGDVALDASIETAVRDASPLPTPKDPADFSNTLLLTFTPR